MRAFQVRAVDYLLKPVDEARFREALERGRAAVTARRAGDDRTGLGDVLAAFRRALAGDSPVRLLVGSRPGRKVLASGWSGSGDVTAVRLAESPFGSRGATEEEALRRHPASITSMPYELSKKWVPESCEYS